MNRGLKILGALGLTALIGWGAVEATSLKGRVRVAGDNGRAYSRETIEQDGEISYKPFKEVREWMDVTFPRGNTKEFQFTQRFYLKQDPVRQSRATQPFEDAYAEENRQSLGVRQGDYILILGGKFLNEDVAPWQIWKL